jgi:hypothetical protein
VAAFLHGNKSIFEHMYIPQPTRFSAFLFSLLFTMAFAASGQETSRADSMRSTLQQSRTKWEEVKKTYNNSYTFSLEEGSYTGHGSVTTITVRNGVVVQRMYQDWFKDNPDFTPTIFVERGDEINTRPEGERARNLDDIYKECEEWISKDPLTNHLDLHLDRKGLLYMCGHYPMGCMDDCFIGVNVRSIMRML